MMDDCEEGRVCGRVLTGTEQCNERESFMEERRMRKGGQV
jgi:hypothetical protein